MSFYSHSDLSDTIIALSTPPGVGALGVIRLSGTDSISIADQVFLGKDLMKQKSHTVHYGLIKDGDRTIDEVMLSIFRTPKSFTKDNMVEITCHGSPYILQEVIRLFQSKGVRLAKAGEFTMRAFLNGRIDLSQAEAVADLIASENASAHTMAIQQMRGGFSKQISELRQQLINFASLIELELDFGEEDVEFADRSQLLNLIGEIKRIIRQLIQSFQLGNAMKNGVQTVIAGRPNAGKSTLLNALLNEDRALVSDIPGTTRDTIEELINIDGIPFRFIDTAGIREARDTIEAMGVEKTMEKLEKSALTIFLFDVSSCSPEQLKSDLKDFIKIDNPLVLVGNKIDDTEVNYQSLFAEWDEMIFISSKDQTNIEKLKNTLKSKILDDEINTGGTIVSNARHHEALLRSMQSLDEVSKGLDLQISGELLALDIRQALHYLGEISGEVSTDDLLGNIFSKFCIGK